MNKRLLTLNGLAIIAVVMNHASQYGFTAMFWWTDQYRQVTVPNYDQMGSFSYYGLVAAQKLAVFSVPAFLFVTGIFLAYAARGGQSRLTWAVVFRRILNLLPPYLIWTVLFYVVQFLAEDIRHTPVEYALGFFTIVDSEFFFVPLVMVYYLLSPILAPMAKNRPWLLLGVGCVTLAAGIASGYLRQYAKLNGIENGFFTSPASYLIERQFFEYFFYYALGLVAGFYQTELKTFVTRYRWALLGAAVAAGALAVVEAEWVYQTTEQIIWRSRTLTLPSAIYAVSFIFAFLGFEKLRLPRFLYHLGVNTLGIYLLQKSVLVVAPKIVYHLLPIILGIQGIYQPLLITVSIGAPLLLMMITRRLPVKNRYRLLFG